jgi:hypothetical protein
MYAPFPALLLFLNASWKSCSLWVVSTACDSASITVIVSKWRFLMLSSIGETEEIGGGGDSPVVFDKKIP